MDLPFTWGKRPTIGTVLHFAENTYSISIGKLRRLPGCSYHIGDPDRLAAMGKGPSGANAFINY